MLHENFMNSIGERIRVRTDLQQKIDVEGVGGRVLQGICSVRFLVACGGLIICGRICCQTRVFASL